MLCQIRFIWTKDELSVSSTLERLKALLKLADTLDKPDNPKHQQLVHKIRQQVANNLAVLDNMDIDALNYESADKTAQSVLDVGPGNFREQLASFDRSGLPDPEPEYRAPSAACSLKRAACEPVEETIRDLDFISDNLDELHLDPELQEIRQQAFTDGDLDLKLKLDGIDQQRFASVTPINPVDDPALHKQLTDAMLDMVYHPKEGIKPQEAMERMLKVYEDAGHGREVEFLRESLMENKEFQEKLSKLSDPTANAGLSDLGGNIEEQISRSAWKKLTARWENFEAGRDAYISNSRWRKLSAFSQKGYVVGGRTLIGAGQAIFGIAQSGVALSNLLKYNDILSDESKAFGYTGVAFGFGGGAFGLAVTTNVVLGKVIGGGSEAGAVGDIFKLGSKSAAKVARFISVVGNVISIAAGIFSFTSNVMAADSAEKYGNTDQVAFFAVQAALDLVGIALDAVSLVLDFVFPPLAFLVDAIATIISIIQTIIGFFAPPPNGQQDFDALIGTEGFTEYIDNLAGEFFKDGYSRFELHQTASDFLNPERLR